MTKEIENSTTDLFIEKAKKDLEDKEITNFFQTEIYKGRHATAVLLKDGTIYIKQTSFHVPHIEPTQLYLSPETFSFLLETMLNAEKEFGIDRKKAISELTDGSAKIVFKKSLNLINL